MCEKIYKTIENILEDRIDILRRTFLNNKSSPKIPFYFRNLIKLLNFVYLISSFGIFKKFLIKNKFLNLIINFLKFCAPRKKTQKKKKKTVLERIGVKYSTFYVNLCQEFSKLFNVLMDPKIGFYYKQ